MPYVITASRPISDEDHKPCEGTGQLTEVWPQADGSGDIGDRCHCVTDELVSRRAVATLDEAMTAACDVIGMEPWNVKQLAPFENQVWDLPESGGTVGPLPDGTVIEVEAVTWSVLAYAAGITSSAGHRIIAAYNAAQEA